MEIVAFLSDITCHLNDLNCKLQGKNNTVCILMSAIRAFQRKLEIFKIDIQEEGLLHFPKLKSQASETQHHNYVEFLDKLIENFETRFGDFPSGKTGLMVRLSILCEPTRISDRTPRPH